MAVRDMDAETAESVAGAVRLLRRAAELVWVRADAEGPRSCQQLLALGVDVAADEARELLPDFVNVGGPVPVGDIPVDLLRSAEQLLCHLCRGNVPASLHALQAQVVELVWEANTSAGA